MSSVMYNKITGFEQNAIFSSLSPTICNLNLRGVGERARAWGVCIWEQHFYVTRESADLRVCYYIKNVTMAKQFR